MAAKVRASRSPSSRSSDRYSNALLGQPQYHNHQDDDHQHPNNDANDASVHFASVKSGVVSSTSTQVVHEPNLAKIAEVCGYRPQVRGYARPSMVGPLGREA